MTPESVAFEVKELVRNRAAMPFFCNEANAAMNS